MTPEQTPPPSRRPRPGADARRRALGLDDSDDADADPGEPGGLGDGPTPGPASPAAPRRESLRDSLARIPDLDVDDDPFQMAPVIGGAAADAPLAVAAGSPPVAPAGPPAKEPRARPAKRAAAKAEPAKGDPEAVLAALAAGAGAVAADPHQLATA
ncbi:MAG: hypothetical protein JWO77_758, partial [Ilumatobacteraceae bacterium]|nr:hypothetical protein [Ilumatobacteraceae bacterium]